MEYKGATIGAIILFGLMFVGAIFMLQPDPEGDGHGHDHEHSNTPRPKVVGSVPDPQPDKIDADADTEYTILSSGLGYKILRKSDKPKAKPSDAVAVAYKGWTIDENGESVFDSSYGKAEPYIAVDPPWGVIEGWKQAMPLVGEGGMLEIKVPARLGYGKRGSGKIKPNSTLYFRMEILKIFTENN